MCRLMLILLVFQFYNVALVPNYVVYSSVRYKCYVHCLWWPIDFSLTDMHVFGLKPMADPLNLVSIPELSIFHFSISVLFDIML